VSGHSRGRPSRVGSRGRSAGPGEPPSGQQEGRRACRKVLDPASEDAGMAGLVFDEVRDVDASTPLVASYRERVDVLASRRSPATVASYVTDAGIFARALLTLIGK
jgi:hypothetical protein